MNSCVTHKFTPYHTQKDVIQLYKSIYAKYLYTFKLSTNSISDREKLFSNYLPLGVWYRYAVVPSSSWTGCPSANSGFGGGGGAGSSCGASISPSGNIKYMITTRNIFLEETLSLTSRETLPTGEIWLFWLDSTQNQTEEKITIQFNWVARPNRGFKILWVQVSIPTKLDFQRSVR